MEQQHRADVGFYDRIAQGAAHRGLARHRIAHRLAHQRHPGGAILAVGGKFKPAGKADRFAMAPVIGDERIVHGAFDAGHCRRLGEGAAQFGMVGRAMVAFAVVFPHQLPIAVLDDRALEGDLGLAEPMRGKIGFDLGAEGADVGRLIGQTQPEIAADALAMNRFEAEGFGVETRTHVASEQQPAVEIVAPIVIGADKADGRAFGGRADARTAMPAGIVKRPHLAIARAHHNDRIVADLQGEIGRRAA